MDQKKRQKITELKLEISRAEKVQLREHDKLKNLSSLKISKEIVDKKKQEFLKSIENRSAEIRKLQKEISDIENGDQDSEFEKQRVIQKEKGDKIIKHNKDTKKQAEHKAKIKKLEQEEQYLATREPNEEFIQKGMDNSYKHFLNAYESLRDDLKQNLKDMPNNKGYIWKGVWFLGEKPVDYNITATMFEKIGGGVLLIHEIDNTEHRVYKKIGKEKKVLVETTAR